MHSIARGLLSVVWVSAGLCGQEPRLAREALVQDVRQLGRILEEAHPDPYAAFGGRIAFHRELQALMGSLPAEGLTAQAFFERLRPFVARLRDGHSFLEAPAGAAALRGPGLPLAFRVVGEDLVVATAYAPAPPELLGARLLAVEGRDLAALRARGRELRGAENAYGELARIAGQLRHAPGLHGLLPDWTPGAPLCAAFLLPDGSRRTLSLGPTGTRGEARDVPSRVRGLPDTSRQSLAWNFLDGEGRVALLRIADCGGYREALAQWMASGASPAKAYAAGLFRTREGRAPKDDAELLQSFPSALECFGEMAKAMKTKGTRALVVDLRDNSGGHSLIARQLVYVLHGLPGLAKLKDGYAIPRYSDLYVANRAPGTLERLNRGRALPLGPGDYDFEGERAWRQGAPKEVLGCFRGVPSMAGELAAPKLAGLYAPPKVFVLCNAGTYSAAFDVACALHRTGAVLVGTPSAQAANGFIDSLFFKLERSGLKGSVSYQAIYGFPEDPEKGRVLPCALPLTYEALRRLDFDPHAELRLVLEALGMEAR